MIEQTNNSTEVSFFAKNRLNILGLLMGAVFGFVMSRAGATTFDYHAQMFLFIDMQLMQVIGTAVVVGLIGVTLLKKYQVTAYGTDTPINYIKKPYKQGLIVGAMLFGIGWGITAACPGTVPAMIGEGKIAGFFILFGVLIGTMAYGVMASKLSTKD